MKKYMYIKTEDELLFINTDAISYVDCCERVLVMLDGSKFELSEQNCKDVLDEMERR